MSHWATFVSPSTPGKNIGCRAHTGALKMFFVDVVHARSVEFSTAAAIDRHRMRVRRADERKPVSAVVVKTQYLTTIIIIIIVIYNHWPPVFGVYSYTCRCRSAASPRLVFTTHTYGRVLFQIITLFCRPYGSCYPAHAPKPCVRAYVLSQRGALRRYFTTMECVFAAIVFTDRDTPYVRTRYDKNLVQRSL